MDDFSRAEVTREILLCVEAIFEYVRKSGHAWLWMYL